MFLGGQVGDPPHANRIDRCGKSEKFMANKRLIEKTPHRSMRHTPFRQDQTEPTQPNSNVRPAKTKQGKIGNCG
jgi:hypothetical protein